MRTKIVGIDAEQRLQAMELSVQSIRQTNEQLVVTMQKQEETMEAMRIQLSEIIRLQSEQKAQSEGLTRAFTSITELERRHDEHDATDAIKHEEMQSSIVQVKDYAHKWVYMGVGFCSALTLIWGLVTTLLFIHEHP